METKYKNISQIENVISKLLAKSGVSRNFFINNLPKEIEKTWTSMVYAELNQQYDRNAYTSGSALIYLYSKPTGSYYRKDVKVMNEMEEKMDKAIREFYDEHHAIKVNWRDSSFDKDREFYYNVISISVFSK